MPLGVIDHQVWVREEKGSRHRRRERGIEEKESYKWIKSLEASSRFQDDQEQGCHLISICDREGDVYDLFAKVAAEKQSKKIDLLVRSAWDRRLADEEETLEGYTQQQEVAGYETIQLPRSGRRKERKAHLEIRYAKIRIQPPKSRRKEKELLPIEVWVVEARERERQAKTKEALKWRVLTTYPVDSLETAKQVIGWYSKRWMIEEYFRVLKTGCAIEERQLRTPDRLENCLAIDAIIAWRILFLMHLGRKRPDLPATILFSELECKALYGFTHKTPTPPSRDPTLQEMMLYLAKLGGFLARKGDGHPGSQVLWRGSWKLPFIVETWQVFSS